MKHISNEGRQGHVISLVFYIKDHHLYPIQDVTTSNRSQQKLIKVVLTIYGATCQNSNGQIDQVTTSSTNNLSSNKKIVNPTNQHYRQ